IVAGLDAQDGLLRIKGWLEQSRFTPLETALWLKELGVGDIIFTDISRDGTQKGVNLESVIELQKKSRMNVIASGGVGSLEDLLRLKEKGAYGAIIGKALYGNKIDLREALRVCR
ncbi:MAG: HisA/HisF-related TIM barrel protein, partial [Christensenellales bacterium]